MLRTLRTVGEPIPTRGHAPPIDKVWPLAAGLSRYWFGSGSSALAAACMSAKELRAAGRDDRGAKPEFIVPAYTCPDVLSAIQYVGGNAVLCDLDSGSPRLSTEHLTGLLNEQTAAVIAVNFQGIPERLAEIKSKLEDTGVALIYDCCQGFSGDANSLHHADFSVFSFGRGKPASALGGGAMLTQHSNLGYETWKTAQKSDRVTSQLKVSLHNLLIQPLLFGIPQKIPLLHIGETFYKPLEKLMRLNQEATQPIACSIDNLSRRKAAYAAIVAGYNRLLPAELILPNSCDVSRDTYLLRLTLIMPSESARDTAYERLTHHRLGASLMYPSILQEILNVPQGLVAEGDWTSARDFASRLLTLPAHTAVRPDDVARICHIVNSSIN